MINHAPRQRWIARWRPRNPSVEGDPTARTAAAGSIPAGEQLHGEQLHGATGNGLPVLARGLKLPAWLVSVVLHAVILLALAAWSFSATSPPPPMISIQGAAPAMEDELQHLTLETPLVDLPDVTPPVPPVRSLSASDLSTFI